MVGVAEEGAVNQLSELLASSTLIICIFGENLISGLPPLQLQANIMRLQLINLSNLHHDNIIVSSQPPGVKRLTLVAIMDA